MNRAITLYHGMTESLLARSGMSDKVLHMQVGLAVFLAASLLLRRPLRSWTPFLIVCGLEAANELMDRLFWGAWRWSDTLLDAATTIFWPLVIVLVLKLERSRR
jgi:hypothetical protein